MTNLTDEGLRETIENIIGIKYLVLAAERNVANRVFEALQQVRDAAKKEEREACALEADKYADETFNDFEPRDIAKRIRARS